MDIHPRTRDNGSFLLRRMIPALLICWACPALAEGLPPFRGGRPISPPPQEMRRAAEGQVPFVQPKEIWDRFLILVWQYRTDILKDLPLYRQIGLRAFDINRGAGKHNRVEFAKQHGLVYYVDHAAHKGYLHLTNKTGRKSISRKRGILARPHSLARLQVLRSANPKVARPDCRTFE